MSVNGTGSGTPGIDPREIFVAPAEQLTEFTGVYVPNVRATTGSAYHGTDVGPNPMFVATISCGIKAPARDWTITTAHGQAGLLDWGDGQCIVVLHSWYWNAPVSAPVAVASTVVLLCLAALLICASLRRSYRG